MSPLPDEVGRVLVPLTPLFSARVWVHAQVLLLGALLTPGKRTVGAALRVVGRAPERQFTNYHRVLNRARWSALQASRIILGLILTTFLPPGAPVVLGGRRPWNGVRGSSSPPSAVTGMPPARPGSLRCAPSASNGSC